MKRSVLAALLLTGLFAACSIPTDSSDDPGQETTVVFDNTRGICAVAVYDSHQRREADKIAEIHAGSSSTEIRWTPGNPYPFYFTYLVALAGISDIVIPYVPAVGKDQVAVRIDENKRTVVPVPALEETLATADELLSSDSYIIIQNVSSYPFQLLENNSSLKPDNSPNSAVVNSGETASYKIIPGTASAYSLRVGAALVGLGSFGSFEAGHIYRLSFDGSTAGLIAETEIKPENILPVQYTVSYDANGAGGTPPAAQTVNAGRSVVVAGQEGMRYSGYVFSGWNTNAGGTGTPYRAGASYTPVGSVTLYARWIPGTPVRYTVTFNASGGNPATQTKTVDSGASAGSSGMPSNPTKSGYIFGGWYTAANGGGTQFTETTPITGAITVYATWTVIQYTVTFDAEGGTPPVQTKTVDSGASAGSSDMPSNPAKSGYIFGGWHTAANGGGTRFTETTPVTGDITVYATWTIIQYMVTFNADGGTPAMQTKTVDSGASVGSSDMPFDPAKSGYIFDGWYTATNGEGTQFTGSTVITGDITVYAKWTITLVPSDLFLDQALTWLGANAIEGGVYTITLKRNETIAPKTLSYGGKNVSVTIIGDTAERTVILTTVGSLFTLGSGVTLTLANNVTLRGRSDNTASLVRVNYGGALVMNPGSKVSGNTGSSLGGGVYVSDGTFTMNGGTISVNTSSASAKFFNDRHDNAVSSSAYGGGVYISGGTFTMSGGMISGNTSSSSAHFNDDYNYSSLNFYVSAYSYGGGVYISGGMFTMSGGTISGNTASASATSASPSPHLSSQSNGGGVYVAGGIFNKTGGTIDDSNSATNGRVAYVSTGSKKRDTTAGVGVTLNSSASGSSGGWE
jgi:uncharacterized repeat protein (TIGR02543 family)